MRPPSPTRHGVPWLLAFILSANAQLPADDKRITLESAPGINTLPTCAKECLIGCGIVSNKNCPEVDDEAVCKTNGCLCPEDVLPLRLKAVEECALESCYIALEDGFEAPAASRAWKWLLTYCLQLGYKESKKFEQSSISSSQPVDRTSTTSTTTANKKLEETYTADPGLQINAKESSIKDSPASDNDESDSIEKEPVLSTGDIIGIVLGVFGLILAILSLWQAKKYRDRRRVRRK